ncbi:hypothetical protein NJB1604_02150 [Mycobacterium marinum]|uniref:helix-turn-helix domain-containing protein n=1 Tax=Mycobacterium marinum TaxID=1781 RepID=UPI0021C3257F|nr:helix-turn-helix domain-containing protein [Mycobacterium marinum]GJO37411.1 hypothetical protein NJB1604_02150 [Mycobacterium marinum]
MRLSDDEAEQALYCVNELVDRRRRAGITVPHWMTHLGNRLDIASLTSEMSPTGHEFGSDSAPLESDLLVGSREAAGILGLSTRQVRRLAPDLNGEIIGGRIVFRRSTVTEYAQEKRNGRHR